METTSIDGLFQQIIDSEQAARRRRDLLNECKQEVHASQEKVKLLQKECLSLHKYLELKVLINIEKLSPLSELTNKELFTRSLRIQEKIYQEQKDGMQQNFDNLCQREVELQAEFVKQQEQFCKQLSDMSRSFGLNRQAHRERTDKFNDELSSLLKEEAELKSGVQQYTDKKNKIDKLLEEREALQSRLDVEMSKNGNVQSSLFDVLGATAKLEEQRLSQSKQSQTDQAFISLQNELDEEKECATNMDKKISKLQSQLQQAQQKLWQQQVRQQQQMQPLLKQRLTDQTKQQTNSPSQEASEDWDSSDMELMMSDFGDADDDNGTRETIQPGAKQDVRSTKRSIFRSGQKNK